jgi:endonuclease I
MKLFFTLLLSVALLSLGQAQINLSGTSYTQNFDGIGAGLPTGFTVATAASGTMLGANAAFNTANTTAWNSLTSGWKNYASATGLTASSNAAAQTASTNRAVANRQSNSTGDPGAALNMQLANTTGLTNFTLSFLLQSLDNTSPRVTTWTVQYGFGNAPIMFTVPATITGTLTTGGTSFTSNTITVNFGNALDNNNGNVWIRIVALNASINTGNRATTGIDDVVLNYNNAAPPCVAPTVLPTMLNLPAATVTNTSISGNFSGSIADNYLVLRSTSNMFSGTITNGTSYDLGDIIGNATVIADGNMNNFTDNSLTPGTTYYYYVFAYNSNACFGGPIYNTTAITNNATTNTPLPCTTPNSTPGAITINTLTNTAVSSSYLAAPDADSYLVLISTNSMLGFTPTDGVSYTLGQTLGNGTVIKNGVGLTCSATGLTPNTMYTIFVFAFNNAGCTGGPLYNTTASSIDVTTTNNTTGIPNGYYNTANGLTCSVLKTALKNIITIGNTPQTYSALWSQYLISDVKPREVGMGSANVIWDIYSDIPGANNDPYNFTPGAASVGGQQEGSGSIAANTEGILYNREHTVPLSWFGGSTGTAGAATDYLHILPTDKIVNSERGSFIYGTITTPTATYLNGSKLGTANSAYSLTGAVFEPINEYKGDVARAFLYFVTRYQDNMSTYPASTSTTNYGAQAFEPNAYPSVDVNYLSMMIDWHKQDPVSQKEIDRNNAAYVFQGNRNPYIDNPAYVESVWNNTCGIILLANDFLNFTTNKLGNSVTLQWVVADNVIADKYIIEKSTDGILFSFVANITAQTSATYRFVDNNIGSANIIIYRVKRVTPAGTFSYSKAAIISNTNSNTMLVYPNPAKDQVNVQLAQYINAYALITITSMQGNTVWRSNYSINGNMVIINLPAIASGQYILGIQYNNEIIRQKLIVIK